jgi:hypothetical protein
MVHPPTGKKLALSLRFPFATPTIFAINGKGNNQYIQI